MRKILLIEDNRDVRENTAEILELAGYQVFTAENGKTGIEQAKKQVPDLIVCDVMMPELDGFGVLRLLAKNPSTAGIPFIFLTAKAEREDMRKGMNLGADDYLTKPFDEMELLDAVETRLKKKEALESEFKKNEEGLNEFLNQAKGVSELEDLTTNIKQTRSIPKKNVIFSEGNYPHHVYFLNKGKVKTSKQDRFGNDLITGLYKEGDFFGMVDVLEDRSYSETAVTLEDSQVCQIPRDEFNALLFRNRDVATKFIKLLSDNIHEKEERLLKLAYESVRKRVAEALLFLYDKYREGDEEQFTVSIRRDDLSAIVGASKETVIRMLSDIKEEGLVSVSGSSITIENIEKLKRMRG